MANHRAIACAGPGKVELRDIDFPKLETPRGRKAARRRRPASSWDTRSSAR